MKKIHFLEKLTLFLYYIYLAFYIISLIYLIRILSKASLDYDFTFDNLKLTKGAQYLSLKIILAVSQFSHIIIIYAIYLFHKNMKLFSKKQIFVYKVIHNFQNIGKYLIISSFITIFSYFLFYYFAEHPATSFNFSFLNTFVLGLFFILLADVFKLAKKEKDNNLLTI